MSSSNVVFAMYYCIPYDTENKTLVPEWPCIIEVSYIYPPTVPYLIRGPERTDELHGERAGALQGQQEANGLLPLHRQQ